MAGWKPAQRAGGRIRERRALARAIALGGPNG